MSSLTNRVLCGICTLGLFVAFGGSAALALQTHKQLQGKEPETAAVLHGTCCMSGLAVDQSSGDLYVVDQYDPTTFSWGLIHRFHSDGSYDQGFDEATLALSETTAEPQDVAVDNSTKASKGRIYLADSGHNQVDAIDSTGALVSAFGTAGRINGVEDAPGDPDTIPTGGFSRPCGLAVDQASADLLVADQNSNKIWIFDATGAYQGKIADSALNGPCGLALDSSGTLYVRDANDGKVLRFTRHSATDYEFGSVFYNAEEGAATDVAVDSADSHVFVDRGDRVAEYEEGGAPVSTFGQGVLDGGATGIAVDAASGHVYVADNSAIHAFGPLGVLPDATTGTATAITDTTATITGTVDPAGGTPVQCVFEYGSDGLYGQSAPCEPAGPYASAQAVQAKLTGLAAATEYQYRLHATSSEGEGNGAGATFMTQGVPQFGIPHQPTPAWVSNLTTDAATLNAQINPKGAATSYHFEYVADALYQQSGFAHAASSPVPSGDLGSGNLPQAVEQRITGLSANTRYDYRIVAANLVGASEGEAKAFTTFAPPAGQSTDSCPNAGYRINLSAPLPDCRAYEMVSPLDKNGANVIGYSKDVLSGVDGTRVAYASLGGFGDTTGSGLAAQYLYLATRGPGGWSSQGITPTPAPDVPQLITAATDVNYFSEDLAGGIVKAYDLPSVTGDIPQVMNLYRFETASRALEPVTISTGMSSVGPFDMEAAFRTASGDLEQVTFAARDNLLPGLSGFEQKLYEWNAGTLSVAGILPDGTMPAGGADSPKPVGDGYFGAYSESPSTMSSDGTRVLFAAPWDGSEPQQLYLRENGASTNWISEPELGGAPTPENVTYDIASPDLKRVIFSTTTRLTESDPGGSGVALYLYTDGSDPEHEQNLTFIARGSGFADNTPPHVVGTSKDMGRIYIRSRSGQDLQSYNGIYLWERGTIRHVVALTGSTESSGVGSPDSLIRVSEDGSHMAFLADTEAFEDAEGGVAKVTLDDVNRHTEMYVYDATTGTIKCASCSPNGVASTSDATFVPAANQATAISTELHIRPRFMSADGRRVFFSTTDALLPQDTNGLTDVYEYNTETGALALLSPGLGDYGTWFVDASASGNDVFMVTHMQLVTGDIDKLVDLYDARAGGGLPEPPPSAPPCVGEACQGIPTAAPALTTVSGFSGPGNPAPAPSVNAKAKAKKHPPKHGRRQHRRRRGHKVHKPRRIGR